jgi:hypothetical protein
MAWRRWIWVEDTTTGAHFDVDATRLDALVEAGAVRPVAGYPATVGPTGAPRRAKPRIDLADLPTTVPEREPVRARPPRKSTASVPPPADPITTTETERTDS